MMTDNEWNQPGVPGSPSQTPPQAPKKSLTWLWILLSVVGVLVVGGIVAVVFFVAAATKGFSPDYSGAPVEFSDASAGAAVVSSDATVAFDLPSTWIDANEYFDINALLGEIPDGGEVVGAYFTGDPEVVSPDLVIVFEYTPDSFLFGDLDDFLAGYMSGASTATDSLDVGEASALTTANRLDAREASSVASSGDVSFESFVVVTGHGQRAVAVQWTSYDGPVDPSEVHRFTDTLRIDG